MSYGIKPPYRPAIGIYCTGSPQAARLSRQPRVRQMRQGEGTLEERDLGKCDTTNPLFVRCSPEALRNDSTNRLPAIEQGKLRYTTYFYP